MVEKRVQNIEEIRAYKKVRLKKVFFYCIFFSFYGIAVQIPVPKDKSLTGRYYRDVIQKKKSRNINSNDALCQD